MRLNSGYKQFVSVQPRRRHKPVMSVKIQDTTCDKERFRLVFHGFLRQKSHLSSCDGLVQDSLLNASERLDLLEKALQGPIVSSQKPQRGKLSPLTSKKIPNQLTSSKPHQARTIETRNDKAPTHQPPVFHTK